VTSPSPSAARPRGRAPRERGAVAEGALIVGALAALGLLAGGLWWLLWDPSYYTVNGTQGSMGEADLSRRFAADGLFGVIALAVGFVAGLVVTWWFRRRRLLTLAALVVGSVAGVGVMVLVGLLLGPGDTDAALAAAAQGARVPTRLEVTVPAFYLAWPIGALFAACLVLWGGADPPPSRDGGADGWAAGAPGPGAWVPGAVDPEAYPSAFPHDEQPRPTVAPPPGQWGPPPEGGAR